MKLKYKLFWHTAHKLEKNALRQKRFINYDTAQTVLLLFESDYTEKNHIIKKLIEQLQTDGKSVCAWGYADKKEITTAILPSFRIIGRKELGLFQKPNKTQIKEITDNQYDILIDLTTHEYLPLNYLAIFARAYLKTGMNLLTPPIHDFIINIPSDTKTEDQPLIMQQPDKDEIQYLFNQIIFYIKSIRSND